jgi:hypothetical protein
VRISSTAELAGEADRLAHVGRLRGDVEAVDGGRPRISPEQCGEDVHDRGLARPVRAQQGKNAAPLHVEVHAAQHVQFLVRLLEALHVDRQGRLCRHRDALSFPVSSPTRSIAPHHDGPALRPRPRCAQRESSRFHGGFTRH